MHSPRRSFLFSLLTAVAVALVAIVLFARNGSWSARPTRNQSALHGSTMGTTYSIRYVPVAGCPATLEMQRLIDNELDRVNLQMSTYRKDSELTRFNDSRSTDWFSVSIETARVVELAQKIAIASNGAFDVTVGPLVNLWGFGPEGRKKEIPSDEEVEAVKKMVGYRNLDVRLEPPALRKLLLELRVDLSAIAKGHGADRVSDLLKDRGIKDSFVEIGGEIVTHGNRADGQSWQIGIEAPVDFERSIQVVIGLSGESLATSGDYRNFFQREGQRFSHTIEPSTGRPVTHQLASASVVADNCALADAIATCMIVMGPTGGMQLAETNGWSVLLIQRSDGEMVTTYSKSFATRFPEVCNPIADRK